MAFRPLQRESERPYAVHAAQRCSIQRRDSQTSRSLSLAKAVPEFEVDARRNTLAKSRQCVEERPMAWQGVFERRAYHRDGRRCGNNENDQKATSGGANAVVDARVIQRRALGPQGRRAAGIQSSSRTSWAGNPHSGSGACTCRSSSGYRAQCSSGGRSRDTCGGPRDASGYPLAVGWFWAPAKIIIPFLAAAS